MCNCKPTGRQTADKIWGRTIQATDSWPPMAKKPFSDAETAALTKIIQDSVTELRRKQIARKPAFTAKQREQIRQVVADSIAENRRKPARESYRISDANPSRHAERITKIRTDNPRLHGEIIEIGGMKCQLIDGRMICK